MNDFSSIKDKKKFFSEISKGFKNDDRDKLDDTCYINVKAVQLAMRRLYGMD